MDEERYGAFRIHDRGLPPPTATNWRRFSVLEDDAGGPILRAGPFLTVDEARRAARALANVDEDADDQARRRQDHRDDGDVNDGGLPPSPRKAFGWVN